MLKIGPLHWLFFLLSGAHLLSHAGNGREFSYPQHFIFKYWTSRDGLPVNGINSIAQTPDGFIWLATQEGLVRFDGIEITKFSKKNTPAFLFDDIYSLLVCRDGSLLIGCHAGHLIQYKNRTFKLLTHPELYGGKNVTALCEDPENGYWLGTNGGGLGHFRSQGDFPFLRNTDGLPGNYINALISDGQGGFWIGTQEGLSHFYQGKFVNFSKKDGLTDNYIRSLYLDAHQILWIGTHNGGLNCYANGKFSHFSKGNLKKNLTIVSLIEDLSGTLWVGTNGDGIYQINDNKELQLSVKDGLSSNNTLCLFSDKDNNLWAGTSDAGINLIKPSFLEVYTSKNGLSDNVILPVYRDRHNGIWIGTANGGLNYFKNGKFEQFQKRLNLPKIPLMTITEDPGGTLWVGTAGSGLYSWKDGVSKNYTTRNGLSSNVIQALYTDRQGVVWIGTNGGGISRLEKGKFTTLTTHDGLSHDQINCLLQDRNGKMWIGTNGGGINRIDADKIKWITSETGLRDNEILTMYEDHDGIIWVGCSHQGLVMIRGDSVEIFTAEDGLCEEKIFQVLEDKNKNLWMSGTQGIFSVPKQELLNIADGKNARLHSVFYSTGEGLLSSECTGRVFPAGCKGNNDDLWFPTLNGLARIETGKQRSDSIPLNVCLTRVFINDQEVNTDQPIELEPGTVNLEIQYTCPGFPPIRQLSFKYMLEGFDLFWTHAGSRRTAYYTHLPPGKYEFKVAAFSPYTMEGKAVSLININILPYFYQTSWFFLLCLIGGSGIFWFVFRYQYRKIKEKELNRLVELRTRELRDEIIRREQTQTALLEAKDKAEQSNRLKSSLLSFLNQDFRTPVNSIMGFSEILMQDKSSPAETGISQYIHESGKRLLDTLDSAMLLAQLDPGKDPPADLQDLLPMIEAALHPLQEVSENKEQTVINLPESGKVRRQKSSPYTLLLVEDNEINAALVKSYLGKDYEVDVATDGETALIKVAEKQYDAILMDINLGKGIDGLTATQKIRSIPGYQSTPIIAVTGYTMAGMRERLIDGGCSYYLAKPFGKKMLVDLLITVLPE